MRPRTSGTLAWCSHVWTCPRTGRPCSSTGAGGCAKPGAASAAAARMASVTGKTWRRDIGTGILPPQMQTEHVDVLIVGAGLSGIGAACHLQAQCPGKTYAILEARDALGGTWDLFRYPGIRSDSDMFTLGYSFRPWSDARAIADGPSILGYVRDTAREHGVERKIRFKHRVVRAEWSAADARWTVEATRGDTGETVRLTCGFLFMCSGYYRYDEGYTPQFEG